MFSRPSFHVSFIAVFLLGMLAACSSDPAPAAEEAADPAPAEEALVEKTRALPTQSEGAADSSTAARFFSEEQMKALVEIKEHYEKGLRVGKEKRTIGYAYTQNAIRLRLDYIEEASISSVHPFNGTFKMEDASEAIGKLPFITKKCGYMVEETKELVNYYCLAIDDNYFAYLQAIPGNNSLINEFASSYQELKEVKPDLRHKMLMNSLDALDLNNWDHQLFYLFFHSWRNEELQAYFKVNAKRKKNTEKQ